MANKHYSLGHLTLIHAYFTSAASGKSLLLKHFPGIGHLLWSKSETLPFIKGKVVLLPVSEGATFPHLSITSMCSIWPQTPPGCAALLELFYTSTCVITLPNHHHELKSLPLPSTTAVIQTDKHPHGVLPSACLLPVQHSQNKFLSTPSGPCSGHFCCCSLVFEKPAPTSKGLKQNVLFSCKHISPLASLNGSLGWESPSYSLSAVSPRIWVGPVKIMAMMIMMGSLNYTLVSKTVEWPR